MSDKRQCESCGKTINMMAESNGDVIQYNVKEIETYNHFGKCQTCYLVSKTRLDIEVSCESRHTT